MVGEWLAKQGYDCIKPEFVYGKSRIDFYNVRTDDLLNGDAPHSDRRKEKRMFLVQELEKITMDLPAQG